MKNKSIDKYIKEIEKIRKTGNATEHSYRHALKALVESYPNNVTALNEPKRFNCGAPDYIITQKSVPIGFIEAKDIGKPLDSIEKDARLKNPKTNNGKQLKRYWPGLNNLILTDYLEFRWYVGGEERLTANIADIVSGDKIKINNKGVAEFEELINEFFKEQISLISTPKELATRMAALAKIIEGIIEKALADKDDKGNFHDQLEGFKQVLLHSLTPDQFADMYAQTICYGLFAAKYNFDNGKTFTRLEATNIVPKSNPFLRQLFGQMAGPNMDERVAWAVDALAELLNKTDINSILKDFGKRTKREDPVVHFYETFLAQYNPKLRNKRGVYYTPEPVVSYIVNSVDHILKNDFGLKDGLADKSKIKYGKASKKDDAKECHKVLILDPAVGTGTFLFNVIDHIHESIVKKGQGGTWSEYVSKHLLPRLFGFELLMAPYSVAHMKLDLQLKEKNYEFKPDERLNVILTNSLEESFPIKGIPLFPKTIAEEANKAGDVKQDMPVMVILGNPPYSGHSQTPNERTVEYQDGQIYSVMSKGRFVQKKATKPTRVKEQTFIGKLIKDYFQVDGKPLDERNSKWINNDYVKFIRFAQHRIEQTGYGILAFITDHSYLESPTFRGMRQSLMKSFDDIFILDLHGNLIKKEICPDGSKDENVFDIKEGVAIGIYVKHPNNKKSQVTIKHQDLWGMRETKKNNKTVAGKYFWLSSNSIKTTEWTEIFPEKPYYLFRKSDQKLTDENSKSKELVEIFTINSVSVVTGYDENAIAINKASANSLASKQSIALSDVQHMLYRPFDNRYIVFNKKVVTRRRINVMRHFLVDNNLGVSIGRAGQVIGTVPWDIVFCSNNITEFNLFRRGGNNLFPLYLYPEEGRLNLDEPSNAPGGRRPNLDKKFIEELAGKIRLGFIPDGKGDLKKTFGPENVFNYMYGVFHSPAYRKRYAEFLKIDFPRLPLTSKRPLFRKLCELGNELVQLHLLTARIDTITKYPVAGDHEVEKVRYTEPKGKSSGKVWINDTQYFEGVPQNVWEFQIGGYQVCDKWLKDRKGRNLTIDDIDHYQYIVSALSKTIKLMSSIDTVIDKHGGWPIE